MLCHSPLFSFFISSSHTHTSIYHFGKLRHTLCENGYRNCKAVASEPVKTSNKEVHPVSVLQVQTGMPSSLVFNVHQASICDSVWLQVAALSLPCREMCQAVVSNCYAFMVYISMLQASPVMLFCCRSLACRCLAGRCVKRWSPPAAVAGSAPLAACWME